MLVFAGGSLVAGRDGMIDSSSVLTNLYFFGVPNLVEGTGWALLGLLLCSDPGEDERRPAHAS